MSNLEAEKASTVETIEWIGDSQGHLRLIDQTRLPTEFAHLDCHDVQDVWDAIKKLQVRGAPAIGIAAAYGISLGLQKSESLTDVGDRVEQVAEHLATSRPTAVNLFWALDRMRSEVRSMEFASLEEARERVLAEARAIHEEDRLVCRAIGRYGATLLTDGVGVLTHCNAGGLATAEYGTALSVFFTCQDLGQSIHVYVDETRPLLQGSRLTAWELIQRGIPATLICDSMAGQVMKEGRVQAVITGADRVTANGDAANKIGTYGVAVLAKAHQIPFYIAAPVSTFDLSLPGGDAIPIEQRDPQEITHGFGKQTAPDGVLTYNPAFDVTPAELITAIITERGIITPVNEATIRKVIGPSVRQADF